MSISVSHYLCGVTKRVLDVALSVVMLVPAMPVMTAVAIAVLVCDGRPVILMQERVGRNGRVFRMPKFRTMRRDPGCLGSRVTPLGRFLRRHRLDELPQLFMVLTGHMSLVGPRPELVNVVSEYQPRHMRRLLVRPGMTGIWQIMGTRRRRIHQEMQYDLYYIRRAALWLDLKILMLTVPFMVRPGEYQT